MSTRASHLASPMPLAHLVECVRHASETGGRLRIQGGATKDFYGEPPAADARALSTRGLNGIVSHEPSELVLTAQAGTPLREVEAALARHGQCLPFEPPHFDVLDAHAGPYPGDGASSAGATMGGMVAAGLSGPARASSGAVRDYVLGLSMVNGRGELLRFGGQVMKNVAGYDVSRLMAGSLGALGVITEVSIKVLPRPVAQATLVFGMAQQAALDALARWGGQPLPLNASAWQDGRLWLRLAGARAAVESAAVALAREAGGELIPPEQAQAWWNDWREQRLPALRARAGLALWRLSVPQTAPAVAWPMAQGDPLIEWHGAQRWVLAPPQAAAALRRQAQALGGHATLFRYHPDDGPPVFQPQAPALARIQARLLRAFDPGGVFGGGRLGTTGHNEGGETS